jgi:hypothetical protein
MDAYGLGKFQSLSEVRLHASRSRAFRLPSVRRKHDVQKPTTYVSPKDAPSRKSIGEN